VGHDDQRVRVLELGHQPLDGRDALGVERRARLVHQDDGGLERQEARDAQLLLLLERELHRRLVQAVLDGVPQRRPACQRGLDGLGQPLA
jgi:hypothetical protein